MIEIHIMVSETDDNELLELVVKYYVELEGELGMKEHL